MNNMNMNIGPVSNPVSFNNQPTNTPKTFTLENQQYQTVGKYVSGNKSGYTAVKSLLKDADPSKSDTKITEQIQSNSSSSSSNPNNTGNWNQDKISTSLKNCKFNNLTVAFSNSDLLHFEKDNKNYFIYFCKDDNTYYNVKLKEFESFNTETSHNTTPNSPTINQWQQESSSNPHSNANPIVNLYHIDEPKITIEGNKIKVVTEKIEFDKPFETFKYLFNEQIGRATHGKDCVKAKSTLDSRTRSKYMAILLNALNTAITQLNQQYQIADISFTNSNLTIQINKFQYKISILENNKNILTKQLDINKYPENETRQIEFKAYLEKQQNIFVPKINDYKQYGTIYYFNENYISSVSAFTDLLKNNTKYNLTLAYMGCDKTVKDPSYPQNIFSTMEQDGSIHIIDGIKSVRFTSVSQFETHILEGIKSCLKCIIDNLDSNGPINIMLCGQETGGYIAAAIYTYLQHFLNKSHNYSKIKDYLNKHSELKLNESNLTNIKNKAIQFCLFLSNPLLGGLDLTNYKLDHNIPAPVNESHNQKAYFFIKTSLYSDNSDIVKQHFLDNQPSKLRPQDKFNRY